MKKAALFGILAVMALSLVAGCQGGGEGDDPSAPVSTTGNTPDPNAAPPSSDPGAGGPPTEASNQPQYNPGGSIPSTGGGGK